MKQIILVLVSFTLLSACSKEETGQAPTPVKSDLSIELIMPVNQSKIPVDCDTTLVLKISDALSLHEYTVEILGSDQVQYFYKEGHTHFSEITLQEEWINKAPAGMELTLIVKASNHAELLTKAFQFFSKS